MAQLAIQPDEPTAAVPLGYFDQRNEPWLPIARFGAWLSIGYAVVALLTQAVYTLIFAWQQFGWSAGIKFDPAVLIIFIAVPSVLIAGLQLVGGIVIIVWTSVGLAVCWVLSFCFTTGLGALNHTFAGNGVTYFVHEITRTLSLMCFRMFVSVVLFVLFRRREVRDVFDKR